jgi:predicted Zn-dependent protease
MIGLGRLSRPVQAAAPQDLALLDTGRTAGNNSLAMAKNERARKMSEDEERSLDAEIGFLEGLLRREPGWVEVMKLLADDYTKRGRIHEGLQMDERLASLCPQDPLVFYNLACSCSLAERYDQAFAALDRAVKLGYADFKWLGKDPDMANLRRHPLFKSFQGKLGSVKH